MLLGGIDLCTEAGLSKELDKQGLPLVVRAGSEGLALAHLPAVTVGRGADSLEAAVMTSVTCVGTLCAAAEGTSKATGTTFKDILVQKRMKHEQVTENSIAIFCVAFTTAIYMYVHNLKPPRKSDTIT